MTFGQVIVGPPASGKSTYCAGMQQWMDCIHRDMIVVNLDPANESNLLRYKAKVDINELIRVEDVMEREFDLGPNGALVYCMEFLECNLDWLKLKLTPFILQKKYIVFDCPGQIELYNCHKSVKRILKQIEEWGVRLCCVQLVDSHHIVDCSKYISVLLVCLSSMINLELPTVSVLSKIDLFESYGETPFRMDYYTDVLDLRYLLHHLPQDPFSSRFGSLQEGLIDVIEGYNLVSFSTLDISDKHSVNSLLKTIDKANGYVYSDLPEGGSLIHSVFDFSTISLPEMDPELLASEIKESTGEML